MEDDLTYDGGHTMQYIDHVSQTSTLEIYVILLTSVTPIHLIKNKNKLHKNKRDTIEIPSPSSM